MSKIDRATSALRDGQTYTLKDEQYQYRTLEERAYYDPQEGDIGALWPLTPTDDPAYTVNRRGDITGYDGIDSKRHTLDLIHESLHAVGQRRSSLIVARYSCDMIACGTTDLLGG